MGDSNNPNQPSLESGGCFKPPFGRKKHGLNGFSKNVRSQGEKSCLQDCDIAFGYLFKSTGKTYFGSLGNLFWLVVWNIFYFSIYWE